MERDWPDRFGRTWPNGEHLKRLRVIAVAIGLLMAAAVWLCYSRPVVYVTDDTPLWGSAYDASRQRTKYPGPGTPLGDLLTGSKLRVLWTEDGKDYRAYFVVGPSYSRGWVLHGQDGIVEMQP